VLQQFSSEAQTRRMKELRYIRSPGPQRPLKFSMDGCVKFAYPHGHDELLMIGLDNTTKKQTLLRTVPDVTKTGASASFYRTKSIISQGFPVTKADDYEMVMVHHHPLQRQEAHMGWETICCT